MRETQKAGRQTDWQNCQPATQPHSEWGKWEERRGTNTQITQHLRTLSESPPAQVMCWQPMSLGPRLSCYLVSLQNMANGHVSSKPDLSTNLEVDCSVGPLPTVPTSSVRITEGAGIRCPQCLLLRDAWPGKPEPGGVVSCLSYVLTIAKGLQTRESRNISSALMFINEFHECLTDVLGSGVCIF